jgi:hypothetical protein
MKNKFCKLAVLALFAVGLTGAALAQDVEHLVRANIPIDFYVGNQLMPAGEYKISFSVDEHQITIGQIATGRAAFLMGSPDDGSRDERTVLTFKLVAGDVYALREFQAPDLGLSFKATAPQGSMRAQNQRNQSMTVIADTK